MGIPCRPRAFRRVAWGRASVRPVEFTGRETVFVACSVQRAGRRSLWRSREEKPKRPLDLWGPEARRPLRVGTTKQAFTPLDLHVDAAADNAMLVNFNAQQASASQVHGMKNRHIGAGRAFSRPSRHPSSAPTRAAMRMFRFRKPEMRRISSSLSEKSNRRYFPRCAVPRAPAAPAATTGYCMSQRKQCRKNASTIRTMPSSAILSSQNVADCPAQAIGVIMQRADVSRAN